MTWYAVTFEGYLVAPEPVGQPIPAGAQAWFEPRLDEFAEALAEVTGGDFDMGATLAAGIVETTLYVDASSLQEAIGTGQALLLTALTAIRGEVRGRLPEIVPIEAHRTQDRELVEA